MGVSQKIVEGFSTKNSLAAISAVIAFVFVEIIILLFGKYLWNNVLLKLIPLRRVESVWEILGLSILLKMLLPS